MHATLDRVSDPGETSAASIGDTALAILPSLQAQGQSASASERLAIGPLHPGRTGERAAMVGGTAEQPERS
jgi:hypothetical protein